MDATVPLIIFAAIVIVIIFVLMNKNKGDEEREGIVKEVLKKDAFVVEFDDQKPTVVKFHGISPASENEMLDDKIFEYLYENVRGQRVKVKPQKVETGGVLIASIYTLMDEYINAWMVRQGFARWVPSEAAADRFLAEAQEQAKAEQLGVWNPAVRQLMDEKMRKMAAGEDDDIANMTVNPDDYETKADRDGEE